MFSWAFLDQRLTFNSFFFLMESIHKHAPLVFFFLLRWFLIQFYKIKKGKK